MQKTIKALLKDNIYWFIAIGITIVLTALSLMKIGKQPISINHLDKIEHAIAYCAFALSWFFALRNVKTPINNVTLISLCCIFYGIIIEFLQGNATSYRTADVFDALANTVGVLIAVLIFKLFFEKKPAI